MSSKFIPGFFPGSDRAPVLKLDNNDEVDAEDDVVEREESDNFDDDDDESDDFVDENDPPAAAKIAPTLLSFSLPP